MKESFSWEKDEKTKNSSKVGKAVYDILSKDNQPETTVGEIISEYADEYTEMVKKTLTDNMERLDSPFYVVVLSKKEPWALNVMRNWFIARQTKPSPKILRQDYPNHMQTVYSYDSKSGEFKLHWSLPVAQDAAVVLRNFQLYDPVLVKWIRDFDLGLLEQSS
jgi:hypothetical protein